MSNKIRSNFSKEDNKNIDNEQNTAEFRFVKKTTISVDEEDGGANYRFVYQRISDDKYFEFSCNQWDLNCHDVFTDMVEVAPYEVVETNYKVV